MIKSLEGQIAWITGGGSGIGLAGAMARFPQILLNVRVARGFSTGSSTAQRATAAAQRGWKAQPGGRSAGLGGSPCSRMRRCVRAGLGMAETSAWA